MLDYFLFLGMILFCLLFHSFRQLLFLTCDVPLMKMQQQIPTLVRSFLNRQELIIFRVNTRNIKML